MQNTFNSLVYEKFKDIKSFYSLINKKLTLCIKYKIKMSNKITFVEQREYIYM